MRAIKPTRTWRRRYALFSPNGTKPVNKYLPPRPKDQLAEIDVLAPFLEPVIEEPKGFIGWLDKALEKI